MFRIGGDDRFFGIGMPGTVLTSPARVLKLVPMLPAPSAPLCRDDLLKLDAFLRSAACGREAMGLSHAHGFLTAAASGPEQLEPDEWIRLVFDEPVFRDGDQAEDILGLALRLYRDIEAGLKQPGGYRPILEYVRDGSGRVAVDGRAWCRGYRAGMSLCREQWAVHANPSLDRLLTPILDLSSRFDPIPPALGRRICDALPRAAEALNAYWRAQEGG